MTRQAKTYFVQQGSHYRTTNDQNIKMSPELPTGHYTILIDQQGYYIEGIPEITVEGKIYGDVLHRASRIITTFGDRKNNTGVLLEGEKGSGKTLLGRILAAELLKQGVSTIVINQPLFGEEFNSLIASIDQPLVIMFDEFEKVYPMEHQQKLLTLLDGTYSKKKLFVVTCNDGYRVVEFMKNRPGRMFYRFAYKGLSSDFVREYAQDTLKNQKHIDSLLNVAESFDSFNFDMLKAIVEEMNRYDESPADVLNYINASPQNQQNSYKVVEVQSKTIPENITEFDEHMNDGMVFNPFNSNMYIYGRPEKTKKDKKEELAKKQRKRDFDFEDTDDEFFISFQTNDIKSVQGQRFVVENDVARVTFVKDSKTKDYSWRDFV